MMLNPLYVQLIHEQKVRELEAAIEMKIRCQEGYACQVTAASWVTRLARFLTRHGAPKPAAPACKAC